MTTRAEIRALERTATAGYVLANATLDRRDSLPWWRLIERWKLGGDAVKHFEEAEVHRESALALRTRVITEIYDGEDGA